MKLLSPSLLLLLISLSSSLLRPAVALCAPGSLPYDGLLSNFLPPRSDLSSAPHPRPQSLRRHIGPYSASPSPAPTSPQRPPALLRPSPSRRNNPPSPSPAATTFGPLQAVADSVSNAISSIQNAFLDGSVKAVCDKAEHPDVCLATIQSVAPNTVRADARTILKLMIRAAVAATQAGLEQGGVLHDEAKGNKPLRSTLGVCTDGFEDALEDLKTAERYLDSDDKGSLISYLGALFSDYSNCGDAFADSKAASPMKSYEEHLFKVAGNCMSVAELI